MSPQRISLLLLTLALSGCGYTIGPAKPTPLKDVKTLAIPTFTNFTYQPRVEVMGADTLIKQFQQDGTYRIVSDKKADAILYGELRKIQRRPVRSVLSNVLATSEFELEVRIEYNVIERVTGRQLTAGLVTGRTSFFVTNDLQMDEEQAIPVAMQRASVEIVARVSEGF